MWDIGLVVLDACLIAGGVLSWCFSFRFLVEDGFLLGRFKTIVNPFCDVKDTFRIAWLEVLMVLHLAEWNPVFQVVVKPAQECLGGCGDDFLDFQFHPFGIRSVESTIE